MDKQKLLRRRSKAFRENNYSDVVQVCTELANSYMEEGQYDPAIEQFTIVSEIHKKHDRTLDYALVNRDIGEAYLGMRKWDKALHHQKLYLKTARGLKNKLEVQRALAEIGHVYLTRYLDAPEDPKKNNLYLAYVFFMKSLLICRNLSQEEAHKSEVIDMFARLFSNLGLVQDCLGNFAKAWELIKKSVSLCESHKLYEQLQRSYMSLASILERKGDSKLALQQYNFAAETAKKLDKKPALLAMVLLDKSELLVKLGNLRGAKSALLKAYKLKTPNAKERHMIETNLRVVASMGYNEKELPAAERTDHRRLKLLYEKMGDGACELKCYQRALDYYKKMLDCAIEAGITGAELAASYFSLAETYKDNGQFKDAIVYYEKELELCQGPLKDSLNTVAKIADCKEAANCPVSEVQAIYDRAIASCRKHGNVRQEARMLKLFAAYLRRQNRLFESAQLGQRLAELNCGSESDSDSEQRSAPGIGADINLDAITDASDDSDVDFAVLAKGRPRGKHLSLRRNVKGETRLHRACITGRLNQVRRLLDQNHPVNVRDNCGWLPLHEAAYFGHVDIVRVLLDQGAVVNDRGGAQCEGITPLHDAASNGHLEIARLLLDKGAEVTAKTDEGKTVMDCLKQWRSTKQLNNDTETLYQSIVDQILGDGNDRTTPTAPANNLSELENENITELLNDLAKDYKKVMEMLGRNSEYPEKAAEKTPVLMEGVDMSQDWLEDNVVKSGKKRKPETNHCDRSDTPSTSKKQKTTREATPLPPRVLTPLEKFKEACRDASTHPDDTICQALHANPATLDLSNKTLKGPTLAPLCNILNQTNLLDLDLSRNSLTTECVQLLGASLASLFNLRKLNLSCTGLQSDHLQILTKDLSGNLHKVTDLDLSHNSLGDRSFEGLAALTRTFRLKKLILSCNQFTEDIANYSLNNNMILSLDQVEELDLSDNDLSNVGVIKIVSWLSASRIKKLNVSRNCVKRGFLRGLVTVWAGQELALESLNLSKCHVQDSVLFDLLGMAPSLQALDLSYNNDLTGISLRRLLQNNTIANLNLYGCANIFKLFVEFPIYGHSESKAVKLSVDSQRYCGESDYLINMWPVWYGSRTLVEKNLGCLYLSVAK